MVANRGACYHRAMNNSDTPSKLLWVDLEMTGLDPNTQHIIEVAAIVTDFELNEIARYDAIIHQPHEVLDGAEDWPKEGLDLLGYLLITEHFMSMELQAFWDDTLEDSPRDAFETFTAEYRHDKSGRVEARILMGSYIERDSGRLEWYQSAQPRRFQIRILGKDSLILEWSEDRSMTLTRQLHSQKSQRDFFGGNNPDKLHLDDFYNDEDLFEDDEFDKPEPEPVVEDDDFRR